MKASAHHGRISDLNHCAGSLVSGAQLVLGSQPRLYLKISSRIGPVKKTGSETAASAMVIALRSNSVPRLSAEMEPTVRYSDKAVVRMLDKIRGALERKPVDATLDIDAGGIHQHPSHTGLAVRASTLHRGIRRALLSTTADRTFVAHTRRLHPKVSTSDLAQRYGTVIIVHRDQFQLTLYKQLKPAKTYSIAVGQVGLETPAGLYHIQNKAVNPAWNVPNSSWAGDLAGTVVPGGSPENPLKARWMGIFDGAGIHGTDAINSIGTAASHGCIRMRIPDVIELYDRVPVGAPVYIA